MNIVQAQNLINDCIRIKKLAGGLAMYPYTVEQVVEAAMVQSQELTHAVDQLSVVKKQLSIANARSVKLNKNDAA